MEICRRLSQARKAAGLDLEALETRTRVRAHLLSSLENGRFTELPSGLYARAVVRSYADAVGLKADEVMSEVAPFLPGIEDPLDGLARVRGFDRKPARVEETPIPLAGLCAVPAVRTAMAATFDSVLLAGIDMLFVLMSARVCSAPIERLLELAAPSMVTLWVIIDTLYFLLFAGLAGATPGTWLAGTSPTGGGRNFVDMKLAGRRACEFALREGSILVELLLGTERGQYWLRTVAQSFRAVRHWQA